MFNLDKLEFNNIREKLASYTNTFEGKNLALNLEPSSKSMEVASWLNETDECMQTRNVKGELPISQINDVSFLIKSLKSNLSLTAKGLLEINSSYWPIVSSPSENNIASDPDVSTISDGFCVSFT